MFSVNKFDLDLPEPAGGYKDFVSAKHHTEGRDQPFVRHKTTLTCPANLCMLTERGMFSGHPMQPNMNHRQMNYESFLSETVDKHGEVQPPLQKSIFENKIEMNFSMGNQMCFSFFAIGPKSDASKPGNIVSQANLTCFDNKKKKTFLFSNMEAKGYVTYKHFHRMLKVFGYQWKQKEGKEHEDKLVSGNALASKVYPPMDTVPERCRFLVCCH